MRLPRFSALLKKPKLPFLVRRVVGESMVPTYVPGQIVVGWRWWRAVQPGDVIVFDHQGLDAIKRIRVVDHGKLYVVGDNPGLSTDSRDFGWIDMARVRARVLTRASNRASQTPAGPTLGT